MSDVPRTYFLVSKTSPVMKVVKDADAQLKAFNVALVALEKEFGGTAWTADRSTFSGMSFTDKSLPAGWRLEKEKRFAVPDSRTSAGRALAKRFKDLPQGVGSRRFACMLEKEIKQSLQSFEGIALAWAGLDRLNGKVVLSAPSACKAHPPGCRELKMSEYWKIREAAEKKKGAKA